MTDLAKWKVRGPVQTLRSEFSEWDLSKEKWKPAGHFMLVRFLRNGRISDTEGHSADGSISRITYVYDAAGRLKETRFRTNDGPVSKTVHFYDDSGRLIRVISVDPDGTERESETYTYGQDGKKTRNHFMPKTEPGTTVGIAIDDAEEWCDACGATAAVTTYDDGGRPDEVLFYDPEHRLVRSMIYSRDSTGRPLSVEVRFGSQPGFPEVENVPQEAMAAIMAKLFGNIMARTMYAYDEKGRLVERRMRMGDLGDQRTTYGYDDHGNRIEETNQDTHREGKLDEAGNVHFVKETSHKQHWRVDYTYDAPGNWTERVVWSRFEPNPNFERSNRERREITYYVR